MSEAIFMVPDFESRAVAFAESVSEHFWVDLLSSIDRDIDIQHQATESYESFIELIKEQYGYYYEAIQLAFHGTEQHSSTNVYDTPGRQFEEDYAELVKRYDPYQVVTD